jgi:hypothetical protein
MRLMTGRALFMASHNVVSTIHQYLPFKYAAMVVGRRHAMPPPDRGLHSFTFWLNVSTFCRFLWADVWSSDKENGSG